MSRAQLSNLVDYELVHKAQDLRGWKVRGAGGSLIGTVADMIVDTDKECVTAILLEDQSEYSIFDLAVVDHTVLIKPGAEPIAEPIDASATAASRDSAEQRVLIGKGPVDLSGVWLVRRAAGQPIPVEDQVLLNQGHVEVRHRAAETPHTPGT